MFYAPYCIDKHLKLIDKNFQSGSGRGLVFLVFDRFGLVNIISDFLGNLNRRMASLFCCRCRKNHDFSPERASCSREDIRPVGDPAVNNTDEEERNNEENLSGNVVGPTEQIQPSNDQTLDENMENVSENAEGEHRASEDRQSVNDSASDNNSVESDYDSESDYEDENDELIPASDSSLLHDAASDGDYDICLAFIEEGVNVNSTHGDRNYTPLHLASLNGSLDVVKILLDNGAVMECKDKIEFTPLIRAAAQGHLPVVKLLVERGARLDATQCNGFRAIHMASQYNRPEVVRYLVQEAGENVDVVSTILPFFSSI